MNEHERNKVIVRTGVIGIVVNVLLAGMKAAVGLIAGSVAVVLDAVNNLSDALSSVITIIGAKLSAKRPDRKHPLGYGRIEYLSAMIVAALVMYAGVTALVESVKKIINPGTPEYSVFSLILIGAAVAVKIVLGRYVKGEGKKADSGSLIAAGSDALFDAVLSASVLLSAILYMTTRVSIEAYVGVVIAGFIIKSSIEMMIETVNEILGKRTDPEVSRFVKELIAEEEGVMGAYDLIINNYGPGRNYASVHIEVPDGIKASEIDRMTRSIQARVHEKTGIILTGIGVYSFNTDDGEASRIREEVSRIALSREGVLQMHGFYLDREKKDLRFDLVFGFDADPAKLTEEIRDEIAGILPGYSVMIAPDVDISD